MTLVIVRNLGSIEIVLKKDCLKNRDNLSSKEISLWFLPIYLQGYAQVRRLTMLRNKVNISFNIMTPNRSRPRE
jgi:hypothetical protein